jgi:hypothetical protein
MGFGGIPVIAVSLLFGAVCANGFYTAKTRRPSLGRDVLVRVLLVESLFAFPAFFADLFMPSLVLSAIVLVPILALTLALYLVKRKQYQKIPLTSPRQ